MPQPPAQYNDTLEPFDPDSDFGALLAQKDIHNQRVVKTLSLRTYERDVERAAREELQKRHDALLDTVNKLEAALKRHEEREERQNGQPSEPKLVIDAEAQLA